MLTAAAAFGLCKGTPRTDTVARGLLTWARSANVRTAPGFELGTFEGGLQGVLAGEPLLPGALLVELPRTQTLQVKAEGGAAPSGLTRDEWEGAPWFARLAMLLLQEEAGHGAVQLSEYVGTLPRSFDTPLHWTDAELAELQSDAFVRAVAEDRASLERLYAWASSVAPALGLGSALSRDKFVWATECVRSRAFQTDISGDVRVLGGSVVSGAAGVALLSIDGATSSIPGGELFAVAAVAASGLATAWQLWYEATGRGATFVMCPVIDAMNHRSIGEVPELLYSSLK